MKNICVVVPLCQNDFAIILKEAGTPTPTPTSMVLGIDCVKSNFA